MGARQCGFESIANPDAFRDDPTITWGFYAHRPKRYREAQPHAEFEVLVRWVARVQHGAFVYTSNVDGQFQNAGFQDDRIVERHGSIHHLQCAQSCNNDIWSADGFEPVVDEPACRMVGELPRCQHCWKLVRPNILMFSDHV